MRPDIEAGRLSRDTLRDNFADVAPPLGAVIGALAYTLVRGDHT